MRDWDDFFDSALLQGQRPASEAGDREHACRVLLPSDPAARDAWQRGTAALAGVRHEHVVPVRVASSDDEAAILALALPAGSRPVRDWVPTQVGLSAGQAVTLGAALARGLDALHTAGACRGGRVSLDDVVVDQEGRPVLALDGAVAIGAAEAADDVTAVAALLCELLADRAAPGVMTLALLRAQDEDPRRRPSALALAEALMAGCDPEPLALAATDVVAEPVPEAPAPARVPAAPREPWPMAATEEESSAPAQRRRRRAGWQVAVVGVLAVVAVVGVVRGVRSEAAHAAEQGGSEVAHAAEQGGSGAAHAAEQGGSEAPDASSLPLAGPSESAAPSASDPVVPTASASQMWGPTAAADSRGPVPPWRRVVEALDRVRVDAFARVDAAVLAGADAAGSQALADDTAMIGGLQAAGVTPRGFSIDVVSVEPIDVAGRAVRVRVIDRVGEYALVDTTGSIVERRPARDAAAWRVTLEPAAVAGQWRIARVDAEATAGAN